MFLEKFPCWNCLTENFWNLDIVNQQPPRTPSIESASWVTCGQTQKDVMSSIFITFAIVYKKKVMLVRRWLSMLMSSSICNVKPKMFKFLWPKANLTLFFFLFFGGRGLKSSQGLDYKTSLLLELELWKSILEENIFRSLR